MDITQIPNLKPLQSINEHEIIEYFAHTDARANKGSLVSIVSAVGNTNVWQKANTPATPHLDVFGQLSNTPSRAYSARNQVTWKVKNAIAGDLPLGFLLFDVRETNAYGEALIFRPRHERYERDLVASGEAVPIIARGLVKINGFVGTPGPGSGAAPSTTQSGYVDVTRTPLASGNVGKFLTSPDADGYALFKIQL